MKNRKEIKDIDELFFSDENGHIYDKVIGDTEKLLIEKALKKSFGNRSIAAKILGINRNTLRLKIKKMRIDVGQFKI